MPERGEPVGGVAGTSMAGSIHSNSPALGGIPPRPTCDSELPPTIAHGLRPSPPESRNSAGSALMLPIISSTGVEIWIVPLTPVGAAAWITLNPNTPGAKVKGAAPPTNSVLPLGTSASTLIFTLPPLAFAAAVLAWMKPVSTANAFALILMSPPFPLSPATEVVIWALCRERTPLPFIRIAPPLPSCAVVVMALSANESREPKWTRILLAAMFPEDAAVIWPPWERLICGAETLSKVGTMLPGASTRANF